MIDIVRGAGLPLAAGIKKAIVAGSLKNFKEAKSPSEALSACRSKGALLYLQRQEFDDGIFVELKRHKGAVVLALADILNERGFRRAIALSKMRLVVEACRRVGCDFVACTLAKDESEVRNARELQAFQSMLGMNRHEQKHSDKVLEKLVK
ncbi:MAG: hypothetical protein N3G22_02540 [Candidatus Micrarchaeota archaeon]|nr:hypothetical protein [Candidatus Micrarchaeota archaeon]